jgi:hypothetical protein
VHDSTSKVSQTKSHQLTAKKAEEKAVGSHHSLDRISADHSAQTSKGSSQTAKDQVEHDSKPSKLAGGFLGHLADGLYGHAVNENQPSPEPKKSMREQFKPSVLEKPQSEGQVAQVLKDHIDQLDSAAGGRKDGIFGARDLEKVATDPNSSPELRAAAEQVLADPNLYHGLDVGNGPRVDDRISAGDLDKVIENEKKSNSGSSAPTFKDLADRLNRSFDTFDSAKNGRKDGKVSREDLEIVSRDESKSEADRTLAKELLADQTSLDAMDIGGKKGSKDGLISKKDLDQARNAASVDGNSQNTWTAESEKSLDKVLNDPNFKSEDLFKGFSQTDRGNCVSTAIIKGALDHYGKDVFKDVKKGEDGSYSVKLQDGKDVTVSRAELQAAAAGSHYVGSEPETKAFANLAYAVMAKRAEQEGHEGSKTFGEALVTLSNGENAKETPKFLGLEDKMKSIPIDQVEGKNGVVAWGDGHCFYVDTLNGKTYGDRWGTQSDYDGTNYVSEKEVDGTQKIGKLDSAYIFT